VAVVSAASIMAVSVSGILLYQTAGPAVSASQVPMSTVDSMRADQRPASRGSARPPAETSPSAVPSPSTPPAGPPASVAGLDEAATRNAYAIVKVGRQRGLPEQAIVIAIATALQESNLYNYANGSVPESLSYPHEAIGWDHDSVGLFQQRASQGWGAVQQLMDPQYSAWVFFDRLMQVPGWQTLSVTGAAQAVQRSAFPDAYQKHHDRAAQIVAELINR
jgi:hypothetical protein